MDGGEGKLRRRQVVGLAHPLGQGVRHPPGAGQGLAHQAGQQVAGYPGGEGIDGDDAPGDVLAVRPLEHRVGHGQAVALALHLAIEDIVLPGQQGPLHIALVEKGQVQGAPLVHHGHLDQIQPLSDAGEPGVLGHHGPHAHPHPLRGLADGIDLPPVLVVPGVIGQQVPGGIQSQMRELFGPDLSHAGKLRQRGVRCDGHGSASFLCDLLFILAQPPRGVKRGLVSVGLCQV